MQPKVAFFTVTHHGDYDFLLGSIEHHAEMGRHLVLDTSPEGQAKKFRRLPSSVVWVHEPFFGQGWKKFKSRSAVLRAHQLARGLDSDIVVYLDSDDFYSHDAVQGLFPYAQEAMVEVQYTHWLPNGLPYMFGESEWHGRLWPRNSDVQIALNVDWVKHPKYNGNPELHQVPVRPSSLPLLRVPGNFRHHLHYAVGPKAAETEIAEATIDGWPGGGKRVPLVPWPSKLRLWKENGTLPSEFFL